MSWPIRFAARTSTSTWRLEQAWQVNWLAERESAAGCEVPLQLELHLYPAEDGPDELSLTLSLEARLEYFDTLEPPASAQLEIVPD